MSKNTGASSRLEPGNDTGRSAAYWRERAAEARASAGELEDGEAKATLHNIAATYESMAKLAELNKLRASASPKPARRRPRA